MYFANFAGALILTAIIAASGLWDQNHFLTGASALKIAHTKVQLSFVEAFARGILCNWLVCLAIWMAYASKQVVGKIFAIFFPITIFVASGYEHCIANMYYIPKGLFLKTVPEVVSAAGLTMDSLSDLTVKTFIVNNLIPVTLGNIIGAAIFVAFLFWVVYLRNNQD